MKRYHWADLIRILAISLVLVVHSFKLSPQANFAGITSLIIFLFGKNCIPLFIMLSGALLLSKQEELSTFFSKRLKRILLPWLFWAIIFFLFGQNQSSPTNNVFIILFEFKKFFISNFTYLPLILSLYLLVPLLRIIVAGGGKKYGWYYLIIWFLGISLLPYLKNNLAFPLRVDNGLVRQTINYSGFLFLGYLLSEIRLKTKKMWLAILLFFLSWLGSVLLTKGNLIGGIQLKLVHASYTAPLMVLSSGSLFLIIRTIFDKKSLKGKKIIAKFSQASYGVFLIHNFVLEFITRQNWLTNWSLLQANLTKFSLTWLASFIIIMTLMKIKVLKRFVT